MIAVVNLYYEIDQQIQVTHLILSNRVRLCLEKDIIAGVRS